MQEFARAHNEHEKQTEVVNDYVTDPPDYRDDDQVRPHDGLNNGSGNAADAMPNLNLDTPEEGTNE